MNKTYWYIYLAIFLFLDALFPILSYFALQSISALWLFAFATLLSLIFTLILFIKKKLYTGYFQKHIAISVFMSSLFLWIWWLLYFFGIKYSSPSTASIILLSQTFFAFIAFNIFWKEDYHFKQIIGAVLMLIWGIIILYQWDDFISLGWVIMLLACISFTIWNFYTKVASKRWVSSIFLLFNRNMLMTVVWFILAFVFVWTIDMVTISENMIWILSIWFLVLFLCKILWIHALKNLDSFVAISSFPIIPLLVMIFSFFILNQFPTIQDILWFIPIWIGTLLLVSKQ